MSRTALRLEFFISATFPAPLLFRPVCDCCRYRRTQTSCAVCRHTAEYAAVTAGIASSLPTRCRTDSVPQPLSLVSHRQPLYAVSVSVYCTLSASAYTVRSHCQRILYAASVSVYCTLSASAYTVRCQRQRTLYAVSSANHNPQCM